METLFVAIGEFRKFAYDSISDRKGVRVSKTDRIGMTKFVTRSSSRNYAVCDTSDQLYQECVDQWGGAKLTTDFREGSESVGFNTAIRRDPILPVNYCCRCRFRRQGCFLLKTDWDYLWDRLRSCIRSASRSHDFVYVTFSADHTPFTTLSTRRRRGRARVENLFDVTIHQLDCVG